MTEHHDATLLILASLVSGNSHPSTVPADRWPEIINMALKHNLGPMLWSVVKQADVKTEDASFEPLHKSAIQTACRQIFFEQSIFSLSRVFDRAQIPCVWLKGASLGLTVYAQPSQRPMGDLDVLVPFELRDTALHIAQSEGYDFFCHAGQLNCWQDSLTEKVSHHYALKGGYGSNINLELHYRLLGSNKNLLPLEHLQWFWNQLETIRFEDVSLSIFNPEAHLLYLIAHAILQHGENDFLLIRFFDMHLLISQKVIDWPLVVNQATALNWTYASERALRYVARIFNTPVPEFVFRQLRERRRPEENISRAIMKSRSGSKWESMIGSLNGLTPEEKARRAAMVFCPPVSYMKSRYNVSSSQSIIKSYFRRWTDQVTELGAWIQNRVKIYKCTEQRTTNEDPNQQLY